MVLPPRIPSFSPIQFSYWAGWGRRWETIDAMRKDWKPRLNAAGNGDILTRWDNLICKPDSQDNFDPRILSLRRFFEKLFTTHNHIRTITTVAWSRRLSPLLQGYFKVVLVPADHHRGLSNKFSEQNVLPIIFPPERQVNGAVKKTVYDELLRRLEEKAVDEGLVMKKGIAPELSMDAKVHAECTLLAYHLRHSETKPFHYFGGSKLSCHGCATLFNSFNRISECFGHPRFFTKGCHNKIYLRWPCPSLLSPEQRIQLRGKEPNLDTQVRKGMVAILGAELAKYVNELRAARSG